MESARNSAVDPSTTDTEEARASVSTALGCPSDSVSLVLKLREPPSSCMVTMVHLVKVVNIVRPHWSMRLTLDLK